MRPDMLTGPARTDLLNGLVLLAGLAWLSSGVAKAWWPLARADIDALAPGWGAAQPLLRWAVPAAEIAVGLALITGTHAGWAGFAGAALAATFALLHISTMIRAALADQPLSAGCGCFGGHRVAATSPGGVALDRATFDSATTTARSWSVGMAATLAMLTWLATLPCQICG